MVLLAPKTALLVLVLSLISSSDAPVEALDAASEESPVDALDDASAPSSESSAVAASEVSLEDESELP